MLCARTPPAVCLRKSAHWGAQPPYPVTRTAMGCRLLPQYSLKACEAANSVRTFGGRWIFMEISTLSCSGRRLLCCQEIGLDSVGQTLWRKRPAALTQEGRAPHGRTKGRKFTASASRAGSDGGTQNVLYPSAPNQTTLRVCVPEPVGHVVPSPS